MTGEPPLRIVHCFRSPVGGIFRHVRDLVAAQKAAGHEVGILCDSSTGGEFEDRLFDTVLPNLSLGVTRIPMRRAITPGDAVVLYKTLREFKRLRPDVVHSHGAKGGAYARVVGSLLRVSGLRVARLYCPHGGSIHYDPATLSGKLYFNVERMLEPLTDRLVFVSQYEADAYAEKVGKPRCPSSLIYNGLRPEEFLPVERNADAADFLFIGMMRDLKGTDVFIDAIALLRDRFGRKVTAHMVGEGPDKERYIETVERLGLDDQITIHPAMPAREAFALARVAVVPSRAESMPYIVLEAIGAGMPMIASDVGGIPEVFGHLRDRLVEPGNAEALAEAMAQAIDNPRDIDALAQALHERVSDEFTIAKMAGGMEAAYRAAMTKS